MKRKNIIKNVTKIKNQPIRVLSLPSYHPYNKRFNNQRDIIFVNPECNFFADKRIYSLDYLHENFPPKTYDIVHIHFEYYLVSLEVLESILRYFKSNGKLIVWTCHDRDSLLAKNTGGVYNKLLFDHSDVVITLTSGCARWLEVKFGKYRRGNIEIISHGYLAHPYIIENEIKRTNKDANLFTMLIGDFRKSKEYNHSIIDFLKCSELASVKLQVIFRSIGISDNKNVTQKDFKIFSILIKNSRIISINMTHIPDDILIKAFIASHAVILPYKWGTHSGQLELARDCGCHVIVSDVGFYKEQWKEIFLWCISDDKNNLNRKRYQGELIKAYNSKSLKPAGFWRKNEFDEIMQKHLIIYRRLINAKKQ